tara:strand:+ start:38391 stop:39728 length:1338 start_codon:yes stop_codon:yes gene_type:complete
MISDDILKLEYNIKYITYEIKEYVNIDNNNLKYNFYSNDLIEKHLYPMKKKLNDVKSEIDKYQIGLSKKEIYEKYAVKDYRLHTLLKLKIIDDDFKTKIKNEIMYNKLSSVIYLLNIKHEVFKNYQIKNVTVAMLKMLEMLYQENLVNINNGKFVHFGNAEMPGNFISATNYFIKSNSIDVEYEWYGNSLLPDIEYDSTVGLCDRYSYFKNYRSKWLMNDKMNGDITLKNNIEYIESFFKDNKCNLYTADGGVELDVTEFNKQEEVVTKLKTAEILCGLLTLKINGSMVIKIYTFFEKITIDLMYLLKTMFKTVKIVKPITSKQANSECYLICINYTSSITPEVKLLLMDIITNYNEKFSIIPDYTEKNITHIANISNNIFMSQYNFVKRNIYYFEKYMLNINFNSHNDIIDNVYKRHIASKIKHYYETYVNNYNLKSIEFSLYL